MNKLSSLCVMSCHILGQWHRKANTQTYKSWEMTCWNERLAVYERLSCNPSLLRIYRYRIVTPIPSTPTAQATCKLHDISEQEGVGGGGGVLGSWWTGRALLHVFWMGKTGSHRISHVQSIPAREERRERNYHSCITIPSLSSASLRRL